MILSLVKTITIIMTYLLMRLNVYSNFLRLIRDGEVGGSGILYLTPTRYTVTTRMVLH